MKKIRLLYVFNFNINLVYLFKFEFFKYKIWFYIRICICKCNIREKTIMYIWPCLHLVKNRSIFNWTDLIRAVNLTKISSTHLLPTRRQKKTPIENSSTHLLPIFYFLSGFVHAAIKKKNPIENMVEQVRRANFN